MMLCGQKMRCIDFFTLVSYLLSRILFKVFVNKFCRIKRKRGSSCRIQHYIESSVRIILKR